MMTFITKEKTESDFEIAMTTIENYFLKEEQYIGGMKEFSIADISAFFELLQLVLLDFDYSKYPRISKWMKKMSQVPEIQGGK